MPELPEAETIARCLRDAIVGDAVTSVHVVRPDVIHGARLPPACRPPAGRHGQARAGTGRHGQAPAGTAGALLLGELVIGRRVVGVSRRAKRVQIELARQDVQKSAGPRSAQPSGNPEPQITGKSPKPHATGECPKPQITLIFRLGMSGRLTLHALGEPVARHTHLTLTLERWPGHPARDRGVGGKARGQDALATLRGSVRQLRFCDPRRFGGVWVVADEDSEAEHLGGHAQGLGPLGPEPLELTPRRFAEILAGRRRSIKALLMDQGRIAGLGNIYCDEALFAARIHPARPAGELSVAESRRLLNAIKSVLRRAVDMGGSTLSDYRRPDGGDGMFQIRHRVYGRGGEPCRRCRAPIEKITLVGRGTHYCPRCQSR